jgi:hypothetical protein
MNNNESKTFANGLIFKLPSERAPDFIRGKISINAQEFMQFLQTHAVNGWVNIDLKVSKGGKAYAELDTYQRDQAPTNQNNVNGYQPASGQGFNQPQQMDISGQQFGNSQTFKQDPNGGFQINENQVF